MFRKVMADSEVAKNLHSVLKRIAVVSKARHPELQKFQPRLVAVTKTKPIDLVKEAYRCGQRNFGENYVKELIDKGHDAELLESYPELKWHFIGHLQRNKVKQVLGVPHLYMVETIDNSRLASTVDNAWQKLSKPHSLKVMVQVNTSKEENKHGCTPEEVHNLVKFVLDECPNLELIGLMTIGSFNHDLSKGPNPDFQSLIRCKETVCERLQLDADKFELSMGMSGDFEHAIEVGSTNVRVGSTIFGERHYPNKSPQVPEDSSGKTSTQATNGDLLKSANKSTSQNAEESSVDSTQVKLDNGPCQNSEIVDKLADVEIKDT